MMHYIHAGSFGGVRSEERHTGLSEPIEADECTNSV